jgi:hypothetical protein
MRKALFGEIVTNCPALPGFQVSCKVTAERTAQSTETYKVWGGQCSSQKQFLSSWHSSWEDK